MSNLPAEEQPIVVQPTAEGRQQLTLRGELNVLQAVELQRVALELAGSGQDVVIDCERAGSMDIAVLQVLLALAETLGAQGRSLGWAGLSPEVRSGFDLAGVSERLRVNS